MKRVASELYDGFIETAASSCLKMGLKNHSSKAFLITCTLFQNLPFLKQKLLGMTQG